MNWLLIYTLIGLAHASWLMFDYYYWFKDNPEESSDKLRILAPNWSEQTTKKVLLSSCIFCGTVWPLSLISIIVHELKGKDNE